jgi:hypothetical protein
MKVQLFINEEDGCWIGETPAICINTNIVELQNEPVLFYGNDMWDVIHQVKAVLKSRGLTGTIQII